MFYFPKKIFYLLSFCGLLLIQSPTRAQEIPQSFNTVFQTFLAVLPPLAQEFGWSLPIYGNHCGPNHGIAESASIDAYDEACRKHDWCYSKGENGFSLSCLCDVKLVLDLQDAQNKKMPILGAPALFPMLAKGWFSISPCWCNKNDKMEFLQNPTLLDKNRCF